MDKDYLSTLPKDVLLMLVLDLDLSDIISLCRTSLKLNKDICENPSFWRNKIRKDFPNAKYTSRNTELVYLKIDKMLKDYPELRDIYPLMDIDEFDFSENTYERPADLLHSLDKNILVKIMNDYNKHPAYTQEGKILQPTAKEIMNFMEKNGLYEKEEYEYYYDSLIEQLKKYIKNPNIMFDPSKWTFY